MPTSNDDTLIGGEGSHLTPRRRNAFRLHIFAVALLLSASLCRGQVFQLDGGSSSLFQATGGSANIHGSDYDGWVGAGSLAGQWRVGAFLRTRWRGATLSFGDDIIPFRLPTDIFDNSHYFLGRGAGIATSWENVSLYGFAGATSTGFGAPYFRGGRAENGVGVLFVDARLAPKLHAFSRNVISDQQTTISGLEWQPSAALKTALSGGVGANQRYLGSSLSSERRWISLKAAYILAGSQFRRIVAQTPLSPESDRENVLLTVHPKPFITFTAGRFNFLQPQPSSTGTGLRAAVNQYSASARAARFTLTGSLFSSRVRAISTQGTSFSMGRDFARRIQATAYLFHSRSAHTPSTTSLLSMLRETLSPHVSLLELVNHANGRTSFSFGGDLVSNAVSIGVEYQTVYVPFQAANPFRQALVLNLRFQPFGNFQVNAGTYIAPDGSVKYTGYGSTLLYHGESEQAAPPSFKFPKYIVRGRVVDESRQPVQGAAVRIDGDVVFTNSEGEFFLRRKSPRLSNLDVLLSDFLVPGHFEVVSCPRTVTPSTQDQEGQILIVLRRLRASVSPPS